MKKYLITILFALMIAGTHAQIMDAFKGVLPVTDKSDVVSLNGTWKFMLIRGLDYSRCGDFIKTVMMIVHGIQFMSLPIGMP